MWEWLIILECIINLTLFLWIDRDEKKWAEEWQTSKILGFKICTRLNNNSNKHYSLLT